MTADGLLRRVARNAGWLVLAQALTRVSQLVLYAVLARTLSLDDYANTTFALLLATMFFPLYDGGLGLVVTRELARGTLSPAQFYSAAMPVKLVLAAAGAIVILATGWARGYRDVAFVLLAFAPVVLSVGEFMHVPSSAAERMQRTARIVTGVRAATVMAGIVAAVVGRTMHAFALGYGAGAIAAAATAMIRHAPTADAWRSRLEWPVVRSLVRGLVPLTLQLALIAVVGRFGILIVENDGAAPAVASFNTAMLVLLLGQQTISTVYQGAFPVFARLGDEPGQALERGGAAALRRALVGGGAVLALLAGLLPLLVRGGFGDALTDAAITGQLMLASLPLFAVNTAIVYYLRATSGQMALPVIALAGLVVIVGMGPGAFARSGIAGLGGALVLVELAMFAVAVPLAWVLRPRSATLIGWGEIGVAVTATLAILLVSPLVRQALASMLS